MKPISEKELAHFKNFNKLAVKFLKTKGITVEFEHFRCLKRYDNFHVCKTKTSYYKLFKQNNFGDVVSPTGGFTWAKFSSNGIETMVKYNHPKDKAFCKLKANFVCINKYLNNNVEFERWVENESKRKNESARTNFF
jgi:hypothetical protein